MRIFSVLLTLFAFGILVLRIGSGHRTDFDDLHTLILMQIVLLFFFNSIFLFVFIYFPNNGIKKLVICLNFLTVFSLLYFLFTLFTIKIGDIYALIPIILMGILIWMGCKILYYLIKEKIND